MASLIETSATGGLLPQTVGSVTLSEATARPIWAMMPYLGKLDAASKALKSAHGVSFPAPGTMEAKGNLRVVWSGLDQAFLIGKAPSDKLSAHAALIDQGDAWCVLLLDGADALDVLSRLVPADLRDPALPEGGAIRTALGHMSALIVKHSPTRFEVFVFRSMAASAVHEIERAMRMVAARAAL